MPVYEYQCSECGTRFERTQGFHDDPVKVCPECAGGVQRLIQPAGIVFKGSGFYVNDSRGSHKGLSSSGSESTSSKKKDSKETSSSSSETTSKEKTSGNETVSSSDKGGDSSEG